MKIGDFDVEVTSARVGAGWQATGILPDGKQIISAPKSSREDAEHDIEMQAKARLLPGRRYDVNRPFESMKLDEVNKWLKGAVNPEHKGDCTPMTKSTCTPRRKALARRFKKGDLHQESQKYPELSESEEAVIMHQADQLLEAISSDWVPPHQNLDPDEEIDMASRSPWTAWEYAQRRHRQHPKLEQAVINSPFEHHYKQFFQAQPRPKASFYPSNGGPSSV